MELSSTTRRLTPPEVLKKHGFNITGEKPEITVTVEGDNVALRGATWFPATFGSAVHDLRGLGYSVDSQVQEARLV